MSRPITSNSELPGTGAGPDCITLGETAKYLQCAVSTIMNWISAKKFTEADGLRRVGGLSRVHFPTLRARFADGSLMAGHSGSTPKAATRKRLNRLTLYEALRNGTDES